MNFLHITLGVPQLRTGGLITYAYAVAETESKMGHTVTILYPGNYTLTKKKSHIRKYYAQGKFSIYKVINPSFVAIPFGVKSPARITKPGNRKMYTDFLDDIKPDIVHVHTFMGFSRELFEEIKKRNIPIVYTTHDYYPICPKTSRVNVNNEICNGSAPEKCALCNANASESMILQYILQSEWYPKIKRSKLLMKLKQKRNKFIQNGSEIKEVNKAENNVFISKIHINF